MNISISAMEVGIVMAICEDSKGEFSLETMCLNEAEGARTNTPLVFQSIKDAMTAAAKIIQVASAKKPKTQKEEKPPVICEEAKKTE